MKKLILSVCAVLIAFLSPKFAEAQERHGFFNVTEAGYGWGTGSVKHSASNSPANEGKLGRFRTVFGHYVTPRLSLGAGIGLDGYSSPNYNTMPLFLDVRGYLRPVGNTPFALLGAGYSLPTGSSFEKGAFANVGLGYKKGLFKWGSLLLSGGLNLHQIKDDETLFIRQGPAGDIEYEYLRSDLLLYSSSVNVGLLIR